MKPRIKVTINGQVCTGRAGQTLLEIAEHNGIAIPNLCHNGELKHYGGCSLCVVEAEGSPKLLRACSTEAQDGQVIYTESERVVRTRKTSIELLMSDHDGDCRGPCVLNCPASVNAQGYIQAIARGDDKEAVRILGQMEDAGLDIEFVEQPVAQHDLTGLKYVTDNVSIPVMADESVQGPADALTIMQMRAADLVNIKLMKAGGLYNALKIASAAEVYGVECMLGCMLEAKVSVNAAIHLACAKQVITKIDLDGPVLCTEDPILGGAVFHEKDITVSDEPGLGIKGIEKITYLD